MQEHSRKKSGNTLSSCCRRRARRWPRPENIAQPRRPEGPAARARYSGYLDHIAFKATGLRQMMQRLKEHGIPFREASIPSIHLHQLFFSDPDGVQVELDYSLDELSTPRPTVED